MENKNSWEIGDVVEKKLYTSAAIYCNKLGDRHIEKQNGQYIVVANQVYVPTLQERIQQLENQYGMNRWQREGILAEGSAYSEYTKQKAEEIELLANELRHANSEDLVEDGTNTPETQENAI